MASTARVVSVRRREGRAGDAEQHLAHGDVLAQTLREHFRRHPPGGQGVTVHAAVRVAQLLELRIADEEALETIVGRDEVQLVSGGEHHALAHQGFEGQALHLGGLEQLRVEARHLPLCPLELLALGNLPFTLADGLPPDLGNGRSSLPEKRG